MFLRARDVYWVRRGGLGVLTGLVNRDYFVRAVGQTML